MKAYVYFMIALSLLSGCGGGSSSSEVQQSLALSVSYAGEPLQLYRVYRAYDIELPINIYNDVNFEVFTN